MGIGHFSLPPLPSLSLSLSQKTHWHKLLCLLYKKDTKGYMSKRMKVRSEDNFFFFFCGWWNFVQVLVMLFHSFLELLLFAYSLRLTLMEAQESCGRTWQVQDFVGAASCCWNLRERERQARSLSLPLSLHHNSQGGLIS